MGARFPAGTREGDPAIESRALPTIRTDHADFDRAEAALREAAASGNVADFQAALQQAGAGCGDCHRRYRAR